MDAGTGGWKAVVLGLVGAVLATDATAANVTVTRVERPQPGVVRIRVRYAATGTPRFQLVPVCGSSSEVNRLIASTARVVPRRREATLDAREDFADIVDWSGPCRATGLAVEMIERGAVVATARVPLELPGPRFVVPPPPPPAERTASRVGLAGQKYKAPQTRMSQAGVVWSLTERLSLHLSYERTAFAPTMSKDHDDGILTGLRLRF